MYFSKTLAFTARGGEWLRIDSEFLVTDRPAGCVRPLLHNNCFFPELVGTSSETSVSLHPNPFSAATEPSRFPALSPPPPAVMDVPDAGDFLPYHRGDEFEGRKAPDDGVRDCGGPSWRPRPGLGCKCIATLFERGGARRRLYSFLLASTFFLSVFVRKNISKPFLKRGLSEKQLCTLARIFTAKVVSLAATVRLPRVTRARRRNSFPERYSHQAGREMAGNTSPRDRGAIFAVALPTFRLGRSTVTLSLAEPARPDSSDAKRAESVSVREMMHAQCHGYQP